MHPFWKKLAAVGFLVFVALWAGGVVRALSLPYPPPAWELPSSAVYSGRLPQANNLRQIGLALTPLPAMLDRPEVEQIRVFDKTAELSTGTAAFDDDEARIRAALAAHQATVFNERNGGIAPDRRLTLEIGVNPDKFDALVGQLRQVGALASMTVQLRDRTDEFRRLHTQRQALKKYLESVLKLRGGKSPTIDDALKLEQKIQDIEKELQTVGVQLGDVLGKESFYLVHLTLAEYQPGGSLDRSFTVTRRVGNAFLWAAGWWFAGAVIAGVAGGIYVSVRTLWAHSPVVGTPRTPAAPAT